jgi:hypothetical protein
LAGGIGALVAASAFVAGLVVKERDNRFCVSCHLHEAKFKRLLAASATDLAGFHHANDHRVGCIACHGGADLAMRVRVWALAGFDTLKFVAGAYGEPMHMRVPLRDLDCRQCHTPIVTTSPGITSPDGRPTRGAATGAEASYMAQAPVERGGRISFHAFREHDGVDIRCVACHTAHTTDSAATEHFLSRPVVEPVCRECHRQL